VGDSERDAARERSRARDRLRRYIAREDLTSCMNDTKWQAALAAVRSVRGYRARFRTRGVTDPARLVYRLTASAFAREASPSPAQGAILLGELQVELSGDVAADERCVLVAWELAHEGRKHRTATLLFGDAGDCRRVALGTWIAVPQHGRP
jgi:hypothetical protein